MTMIQKKAKKIREAKYRKSIVTFLDVLGFRELVGTRTAAEVGRVVRLMRYFGGVDDEALAGHKVFTFSDSIIRVVDAQSPSALHSEVVSVLHIQGELINKDVLVRGAITYGDVAVHRQGVFGPAFIHAYDLESKVARHPRVVVDELALDAVRNGDVASSNDISDAQDEFREVRKLLRQDKQNEPWFIDYLRHFPGELNDPELHPAWLRAHARLALKLDRDAFAASQKDGPSANKLEQSLKAKAQWLRAYHNEIVEGLPEDGLKAFGSSKQELRIKTPSWSST